jgi:hypothetical protein
MPVDHRLSLVIGLMLILTLTACDRSSSPKNPMTQSISQQSNLPLLPMGTVDDVLNQLDMLDQKGGTNAVSQWAEQELQPGRQITYKGRIDDGEETVRIYDRSIWRLDEQGQISKDAILAPLTEEKYGESEIFTTWTRGRAKEPFVLRLRVWKKS